MAEGELIPGGLGPDDMALVLSIDPSDFAKGAAQAEAIFNKFQTSVEKKTSEAGNDFKDFEGHIKGVRDRMLSLFAVFAAGRGLHEFSDDAQRTTMHVANMSRALGVSANSLAVWETAARRTGSSAAAMDSVFANVNNQLQAFQVHGQVGPMLRWLNLLRINPRNQDGTYKTSDNILRQMTEAAEQRHLSRQAMNEMLNSVGAGADLLPLLGSGARNQNRNLSEAQAVTPQYSGDQLRAAENWQKALTDLEQASYNMGLVIKTAFTPAVESLAHGLTALSTWGGKHPRVIIAAFGALAGVVTALSAAMAVSTILAFGSAIGALGLPIGAVVAGSAALGATLGLVVTHFDDVKRAGTEAWDAISNGVSQAAKIAEPYWRTFTRDFVDRWNLMKAVAFGSSDDIRGSWQVLVQDMGSEWKSLTGSITAIWSVVKDDGKAAWDDLINWIATSGDRVAEAIRSAMGVAWNVIRHPVATIENVVSAAGRGVASVRDAERDRLVNYKRAYVDSYSEANRTSGNREQYLSQLDKAYDFKSFSMDALWAQESQRGKYLVSNAGARGHFQLMPGTAKQYGVTDAFDFGQGARAAAEYMSDLRRRYQGDESKALAAYNWGPGNVDRDVREHGDDWRKFLPRETANYVPSVINRTRAVEEAGAINRGRDYASKDRERDPFVISGAFYKSNEPGNTTTVYNSTDARHSTETNITNQAPGNDNEARPPNKPTPPSVNINLPAPEHKPNQERPPVSRKTDNVVRIAAAFNKDKTPVVVAGPGKSSGAVDPTARTATLDSIAANERASRSLNSAARSFSDRIGMVTKPDVDSAQRAANTPGRDLSQAENPKRSYPTSLGNASANEVSRGAGYSNASKMASMTTNNNQTSSNIVHIAPGAVQVSSPSADPRAVANEIPRAFQRHMMSSKANSGVIT